MLALINSLVDKVIEIRTRYSRWRRRRFLELARRDPHSAMAIHAMHPNVEDFALPGDMSKGCDRCMTSHSVSNLSV